MTHTVDKFLLKQSGLNIAVRSRISGFTLVEMLVSIALGLGVLLALSAVYVAGKKAYSFQENTGRLQEDAVFALDTISRDLRMAGFAGCRGVDSDTTTSPATYYPTLGLTAGAAGGINGPNPLSAVFTTDAAILRQPLSASNVIRGFDTIPSAFFSSAPSNTLGNSLFFSGGSSNSLGITSAMAAPSTALTVGTGGSFTTANDPAGWGSTKVYNMVVSDCTSSAVFVGQFNAGLNQIIHTAATTGTNNGTNSADNFPGSYKFGTDAILMPIEWNFYYVATRSGASTPSLYRVFFDGNARQAAQEIVANVESMKLNYGENLNGVDTTTTPGSSVACTIATGGVNCTPTRIADVWRTTAASVTDWSHVVAVRIGLMMVSAEDTANKDVAPATPTLLGQAYTRPSGASATRLRKEFSTTVVLRNSSVAR